MVVGLYGAARAESFLVVCEALMSTVRLTDGGIMKAALGSKPFKAVAGSGAASQPRLGNAGRD